MPRPTAQRATPFHRLAPSSTQVGADHILAFERPSRLLPPSLLAVLTLLVACLLLPACSSTTPATAPTAAPSQPPLALTVTTESWSFKNADGRLLRTPSYRILTTDDAPLVADRMPAFLESALANYRSLWATLPAPAAPLEVYLFATRPQWESFARQTAGPRADIYLRIQRGGYSESARSVFYNIGPRDTFAIAGHEGWHQYTQSVFKEPLPIWLEEGISVSMEGFRWADEGRRAVFLPWSNLERYDRLREIVATGRLVHLDQLLLLRPQDLLQDSGTATLDYYAQVWALALFLREGADGSYRQPLERILLDASTGRMAAHVAATSSVREARAAMFSRVGHAPFTAYFGDLGRAATDYDAFVRFITRPGGRSAVLEGSSPR